MEWPLVTAVALLLVTLSKSEDNFVQIKAADVAPLKQKLSLMQQNQVGGAAKAVTQLKLSDDPRCSDDIKQLCPEATNNFAVMDCLQNKRTKDSGELNLDCQHLIWNYKKNLTKDPRFDSAASQVCKADIKKLGECEDLQHGVGYIIPCLFEQIGNVTSMGCKSFINKMGSIVFSDYRLIDRFVERCQADIDDKQCGRLHTEEDDSPHTQGVVIKCLEKAVRNLRPECKTQILRLAELQSDDYHLNRPLYYACRDDRETLCKDVQSGNGLVLKCLVQHKFEKTMSDECREEVTEVQQLEAEDVKVNRPLIKACREAIKANKCIPRERPDIDEVRQAKILLCLESAIRESPKSVPPQCRSEVRDVRRALMDDYKVSPLLMIECQEDIKTHCNALEREGKTLHCLMHAIETYRSPKNSPKNVTVPVSDECRVQVEKLMETADVAEDLFVDPQLTKACQPAIAKCQTTDDLMSCLMELVEAENSDVMTTECADRLLEVQFFVSRDFRLNPTLYSRCHKDAVKSCSASESWYVKGDTTPEQGPRIFACLYGLYKYHAADPDLQLTRECAFEVRRSLRQRAAAVELNPRIQEACLQDLAYFCEKSDRKSEMGCLQKNYKELEPECQKAVGNFTEDEDMDVQMDRMLVSACAVVLKKKCGEIMSAANTEPGDVIECLITHKDDDDTSSKCRAGIEHHQIVSLDDYRFTYKLKEACKMNVQQYCRQSSKSKSDVIECLSEMIRDDTIRNKEHRVSGPCRNQVTFELLQRSEDFNLDPKLKAICMTDIDSKCAKEKQMGKGAVLRCLEKVGEGLSEECAHIVLKREEDEAVDTKADFPLFTACKRMIKTYCQDTQPGDIFDCLREHRSVDSFDETCSKMLIERMRERATNIHLNPKLEAACSKDIDKHCKHVQSPALVGGKFESLFQAAVLTCLRTHFGKDLEPSCEEHLADVMKDAALDYKQNPNLAKACKAEITENCMSAVNNQDLDDHGQVEECLKKLLAQGKVKDNPACLKEIVIIIRESKIDVHIDPVLYKACSLDIQHYCKGVSRGEGRQMSCLLAGLDDKKVTLQPACRKMVQERLQLWSSAAQAAPEDWGDIMLQVHMSPNRNYFYGVILTFLGCIFFGGLMCGRVTKRIRAEIKNR